MRKLYMMSCSRPKRDDGSFPMSLQASFVRGTNVPHILRADIGRQRSQNRELHMIDMGDETIDFPCPRCGFYNPIFLKQARLRDVVICRGCKTNIQLDDQMNECRNALRAIRRAGQELEDALGDATIRIEL